MNVELSAEAHGQVLAIDAWWRENRPAAADLFARELAHALAQLEATPTLGSRYDGGPSTIRRILLGRSLYHLYFEERPGQVFVVAVWSAHRGRGPTLNR